MSLLLWLPLIDGTENQGLLGDITPTYKSFSIDSYGKIGKCHKGLGLIYHFDEEILGNQWTLTTWVKVESWGTANNILFCKNISGTDHCQFYLSIINGRALNLGVNGGYSITTYSYTFETNKWYHISATYDGSNYVLYINGDVVKRGIVTNPLFTDCVNLGIGQRSTDIAGTHAAGGGNDRYYNDVRIYDTALSPREIKLISQGLALHYPMSSILGYNVLKGYDIPELLYIAASGGVMKVTKLPSSAPQVNRSVILKCNSNTTYTLSINQNVTARIASFTQYPVINSLSTYSSQGTSSTLPLTLTITTGNDDKYLFIQLFVDAQANNGMTLESIIDDVTLLYGSEEIYEKIGLNDNIEYDVSGYQRNGIRNNITYSGDTPRYNGSYVFNGTSSYVMTNDNSYAVQGATELTVNEWAYADDWSTQANSRLWSCTEGGGFNTENGGTGKLRFPVNTYTKADLSTHGYNNTGTDDGVVGFKVSTLSSGWHMFTVVYTTSSITTYVDGILHETRNITSYGVYFNTSNIIPMTLGAEATSVAPVSPYFNGKLSDFRLYYTALSADDILDLYNTPTSLSSNGTLLTNSISEE